MTEPQVWVLIARFAVIEVKLENLDTDVQALSRQVFAAEPR